MASSGDAGTVTPAPNFNAEADCEVLRKAMKGLGTDEKALINLLCYRSNAQRQELKIKYKSMFGRDLVDDIKGELSGHFEDVMLGIMMPIPDFAAYSVKKAVKGLGTDEETLIEVICTATNEELTAIKEAYKRLYKKSMEDAVRTDLSGDFKRMMVSLMTASREPEGPVDQAKAAAEAKALYDAGEGQMGTDESKFNQILCVRSYSHLRAVFADYARISKTDIVGAIKKEMSGDLEKAYLAVVRSVMDRPSFFADRLYRFMKGAGTDDDDLVRVVVARCEVDMVQIKEAFPKLYNNQGKSLASFIKGDTSGDYERSLLALIREK
ncbi:annexin A4-like [Halichondria panicea]|uniref:annexin A4-like n=1 Tax=Halichondria panicea TaxID=6063 RepID=UPI00312B8A9A